MKQANIEYMINLHIYTPQFMFNSKAPTQVTADAPCNAAPFMTKNISKRLFAHHDYGTNDCRRTNIQRETVRSG
jgi:hypothetical protein